MAMDQKATAKTIEALRTLGILPDDAADERGLVEVIRSGTQIVLPEGMNEDQAIEWLKRKKAADAQPVHVNEVIDEGFVLDAALAFMRALKERYGWTGLAPTMGFWGPQPPDMIGVPVNADGDTVEVPWGNVTIPGIVGELNVGVVFRKDQPCLVIGGTVQKRYLEDVKQIAKATRVQLRTESIYRGKAIRVSFDDVDEDSFDPRVHRPEFMRLDPVRPEDLVFREEVGWAIATSVWTPVVAREQARRMGVPGKRVVLLAGKYGTGKTSVSQATANLCVDHRTTFIYVEKTGDLTEAVRLARQYQPAVVFAEDVDSVVSGTDRSEDTNDVLNVLDGVEGKSAEVMVILSTNHPERINRALLRPGRVDDVITLLPPDRAATEELIRRYAGDLLAEDEDVGEATSLMDGQIPAAIAEVVRRAKLSLLARGEDARLTGHDLALSARSIQPHLTMLNASVEVEPSDFEKAGAVIGNYLARGINLAGQEGHFAGAPPVKPNGDPRAEA